MADVVQVTIDGDEYAIAFDPRHAYVPVEAGSRTGKIRTHYGKLRIIVSEQAFQRLQQALEEVRTQRGV